LPQTPSEQVASAPIVNPAASAIAAASFRDRRPLMGHHARSLLLTLRVP
jgi:hypothetical protein